LAPRLIASLEKADRPSPKVFRSANVVEATGNAAAVASVISPFRRKSFNTWTA
jgi:hypothetical protein